MARLLMINYRFPPSQFVSCKRLGHLFLAAKSVFEDIHVITSKQNNDYPADPLLQFQVSNKHLIDHSDLRAKLHFKSNNENPWIENMKRSYLGQKVLEFRKRWPLFYYFGDGGSDYIRKTVNKAKIIIEEHQITHIFTSYGPYADVVIGKELKKSHPDLVWIADFRDLFENKPWRGFKKGYPFWHLNKIVQNADYITTVSKGLAAKFSEIHPKVNVLYNGLGALTQHPEKSPSGLGIRISYTGSLYHRWNALDLFLKIFKNISQAQASETKIQNVSLNYFGPDNSVFQNKITKQGLKKSVFTSAAVSMKSALRIQKESQINLLLSWAHQKQKGILNAKLFEYLASGRPIFAVVDGPIDNELKYWVEDVGNGKCFFSEVNSPAKIADGLNDLIGQIEKGSWSPPKSLPNRIYWSVQGLDFWKKTIDKKKSKRTP
jgi:hypothetical protein